MHNETMLKGYQWSPVDGRFIGEYEFPDNKDRVEVHLPPLTTLTAPPTDVPCGCCVFWREGAWVIENSPDPKPTKPPIDDYAMLLPWFIEHLKAQGMWDEEDETKLAAALAAQTLAVQEAIQADVAESDGGDATEN